MSSLSVIRMSPRASRTCTQVVRFQRIRLGGRFHNLPADVAVQCGKRAAFNVEGICMCIKHARQAGVAC